MDIVMVLRLLQPIRFLHKINLLLIFFVFLSTPCKARQQSKEANQNQNQSQSQITILLSEQLDESGKQLPTPPHLQRLFSYLENELNLRITTSQYPWPRVMQRGEQGIGLVFGISKTPERLLTFNFSDPIFQQKIWLISLCENKFNYSSIKDLKGKTVGLARFASVNEEFDSNAGGLFKVDFDATTYAARFLKLAAHRSDVIVYYTPLNATALEKKINKDYSHLTETPNGKTHNKFCVINNPIDVTDIHFGLSKRVNSEPLKQINLALQKAKRKGLMPDFAPPSK